jgi:predicted HTH domain antitoxin
MSDVIIPANIVKATNLNELELLLKVAIDLYTEERLTLEQASELAQLDRIAFQQTLSSCGISINYDIPDIQEDLHTLDELKLSR